MVNGLHLYSAFIQSAVQFMLSFTHSHTIHTPTAIGCHARYQPARQEQLGVRCLAQGHFDTPRVGSNRQPSDCQTTALTSWAISQGIRPKHEVETAAIQAWQSVAREDPAVGAVHEPHTSSSHCMQRICNNITKTWLHLHNIAVSQTL